MNIDFYKVNYNGNHPTCKESARLRGKVKQGSWTFNWSLEGEWLFQLGNILLKVVVAGNKSHSYGLD